VIYVYVFWYFEAHFYVETGTHHWLTCLWWREA